MASTALGSSRGPLRTPFPALTSRPRLQHNFMMSDEGRANFQLQLKQIVGSIQ